MNKHSSNYNMKNNIITLYPKDARNNTWYLASICLLGLAMVFNLLFSNVLSLTGKFPLLWFVILFISAMITITNFEVSLTFPYIGISYMVSIPMILNYFLFKASIYIPNHIVLICSFSFVIIYKTMKEFSNNCYRKVYLVILLVTIFFSTNYYFYSNRIIKDSSLNIQVKKALNINSSNIMKSIDIADLTSIDMLAIRNITSLDGIEYMTNLNALDIIDNGLLLDYSPIKNLNNLKSLSLSYADLNTLSEIDLIDNINNLEIIYPKNDSMTNLPLFTDVNHLTISFSGNFNLSTLKNFPNVETLSLRLEGPLIIDGLEVIKNLNELNLSYAYVPDYSNIFEIPSLKTINLSACQIVDLDGFLKTANEKGINVTIASEIAPKS